METGLVSSNALEIIQPRVVELEISRFNDKRIEMVAGKNTGCVEWETGLERRRRVEVELREFRDTREGGLHRRRTPFRGA